MTHCFMGDRSGWGTVCTGLVKLATSAETVFYEGVFVSALQESPYATLTMSLAQTNFCRKHGYDPQSPLCAHVILAGTVTKVRGYLQTHRLAAKEHCLANYEGRDNLGIK